MDIPENIGRALMLTTVAGSSTCIGSAIVYFCQETEDRLPFLFFGIPFVIILTGYMMIASIEQGRIVQMIEKPVSN